jgi:hypothetical protein
MSYFTDYVTHQDFSATSLLAVAWGRLSTLYIPHVLAGWRLTSHSLPQLLSFDPYPRLALLAPTRYRWIAHSLLACLPFLLKKVKVKVT